MRPSSGSHVEIARLDSLKHGIVFDRIGALSGKFIAIDEHGNKDFDLASHKVGGHAHPRPHRKGDIGPAVAILHPVGVPSFGRKLGRVVPNGGIVVQMMDFGYDHAVLGNPIPSRKDDVFARCPSGLKRGGMAALSLFDEFIEIGQIAYELARDVGSLGHVMVQ